MPLSLDPPSPIHPSDPLHALSALVRPDPRAHLPDLHPVQGTPCDFAPQKVLKKTFPLEAGSLRRSDRVLPKLKGQVCPETGRGPSGPRLGLPLPPHCTPQITAVGGCAVGHMWGMCVHVAWGCACFGGGDW
uniref:Uncharacterized protein n=1 Tax=Ornithorhynchus anatinus TaxID=9258 RepID=A0A6I8PRY3_ORNAN